MQKIDTIDHITTDKGEYSPFPCTACGECCRRVSLSPLTEFLSRGDGVCEYLDELTNLCKIYNDRPLICRVEEYYKKYLVENVSWKVFVNLNIENCANIQAHS